MVTCQFPSHQAALSYHTKANNRVDASQNVLPQRHMKPGNHICLTCTSCCIPGQRNTWRLTLDTEQLWGFIYYVLQWKHFFVNVNFSQNKLFLFKAICRVISYKIDHFRPEKRFFFFLMYSSSDQQCFPWCIAKPAPNQH